MSFEKKADTEFIVTSVKGRKQQSASEPEEHSDRRRRHAEIGRRSISQSFGDGIKGRGGAVTSEKGKFDRMGEKPFMRINRKEQHNCITPGQLHEGDEPYVKAL